MREIRIPLALAVILIAMLSLVNVSAFKSGVAKGPLSVTVRTTGNATLALSANTGTNSVYQVTESANGMLQIHFGKGLNGTVRSLQTNRNQAGYSLPGDNLKMMGVFIVTNNSTVDCVDISVYVSSWLGTQTNVNEIRGRPVGTAWGQSDVQLATTDGAQSANRFKLGTSGSGKNRMYADFRFNALNTVSGPNNTFTVVVSGTKGTCPP